MAGTYVGASGDLALGLGVGANVLVGGSNRSFGLQPVPVESVTCRRPVIPALTATIASVGGDWPASGIGSWMRLLRLVAVRTIDDASSNGEAARFMFPVGWFLHSRCVIAHP
ncbi:DUF992 domain-containing protein [Bradyrhizobium sp. Pha-3]|uniref:DUF992 domain-containing protein n=1 Tax=Bradyrhizobium sp. Pha-3 TaxID=208375 RepID=UPI0035D528BF